MEFQHEKAEYVGMLILQSLEHMLKARSEPIESVVTIGNFDGLHRGHSELIEFLTSRSKQLQLPSVLLSFRPHPLEVLYPEREFYKLDTYEDQVRRLGLFSIDYFISHAFTLEFAKISAEDFLKKWLFKYLKPRCLIVGYDFSFGFGRGGQIQLLQEFCQTQDCELHVVPAFKIEGEIVSSTRIRDFLKKGLLSRAKLFLGRNYSIESEVVKGDQRGRTIGFPTANFGVVETIKPKPGVYITQSIHNEKTYASMTNVGWNPTVQKVQKHLQVETHLLHFDQEIYGEKIRVEFLDFLREEHKFSSLDELKAQLNRDKESVQRYLSGSN